MIRPALVVAAMVFGGCISLETTAPSLLTPADAMIRSSECPPGADVRPSPDACIGMLARPDAWLGEPYLAADPTRPGVLALGVNAVTLLPSGTNVPLSLTAPSAGLLTALFITQDAGASWSQVPLPTVPGFSHGGDPTLVFDGDGVLHVGELAVSSPNAVQIHSTPDLGRTWRSATVARGVDRPWLTMLEDGTLAVTWQTSDPHVGIAWSKDDGASWSTQDVAVDSCNLQTGIVDSATGPIFACIKREGDRYRSVVNLIDFGSGQISELATFESGSGTLYLGRTSAGQVALLTQSYQQETGTSARVHWSTDGRQWVSPEVYLRQVASIDDAWTWMWNAWMVPDANQTSHVIVVGGTGDNCFRGTCDDAAVRRQVGWVSLAGDGTIVAEGRLTPDEVGDRENPLGSRLPLGTQLADDYATFAYTPNGLWAAWGHDGAIGYTVLR